MATSLLPVFRNFPRRLPCCMAFESVSLVKYSAKAEIVGY